jgi:hypothetical protein
MAVTVKLFMTTPWLLCCATRDDSSVAWQAVCEERGET